MAWQRKLRAEQEEEERRQRAIQRKAPVDQNAILVVPRDGAEPEVGLDDSRAEPPPGVRGVMIESAGLEICLLAHQYQCCVRLGKQRGTSVCSSFKKASYRCMNWKDCPFCLNVRTPLNSPERCFLEVTSPHVHMEPAERKKEIILSEMSRVIRRMYARRSQDIQREVARVIKHCISVPDIIGAECERLFPQYAIPRPTAYRLGDLLPSRKRLNSRRHLVRKELG